MLQCPLVTYSHRGAMLSSKEISSVEIPFLGILVRHFLGQ